MNESYTSFAQVYDMFMDNVDYPSWSKYLIQLLKEYQVEEASFIWDNYYDPEEEINEYELAIFIPAGGDSDLYRKFEEVHYQRAYDLAMVRRLLEEAGMEFVTAYDAFTKDVPKPESERIYVVAREKGKSAEK